MQNNELKSKGITLISLVITIIILLILAGITISTLTGENGLFTRAKEANVKTQIARDRGRSKFNIYGINNREIFRKLR